MRRVKKSFSLSTLVRLNTVCLYVYVRVYALSALLALLSVPLSRVTLLSWREKNGTRWKNSSGRLLERKKNLERVNDGYADEGDSATTRRVKGVEKSLWIRIFRATSTRGNGRGFFSFLFFF